MAKCGASWLVLLANVSRLIISRWKRWASHLAYMWQKRHAFGVFTEGKRLPGSLGLCGKIIWKMTLKKSDCRTNRLDSSG